MKKFTTLVGATLLFSAFGATANATDVVVMKFVSDDCQTCAPMESQVDTAVAMINNAGIKTITVDVSNAALWTRGAHDAFNADVVPVFNKYVGLTGFAVIVEPKTRKVVGCVNNKYDANQVANFIKQAARIPHTSSASVRIENFRCPTAYNKL